MKDATKVLAREPNGNYPSGISSDTIYANPATDQFEIILFIFTYSFLYMVALFTIQCILLHYKCDTPGKNYIYVNDTYRSP